MKQDLNQIKIKDEYGTPNLILKQAMMDFDILPFLDVCATFDNTKFRHYFTKKENALTKNWAMDFFMNPPYSEIAKWMKKAYESHIKYNVSALILTYAKTDTKWWHSFVESKAETYFIKRRVRFLDENGIQTNIDAPYPSVWIIYRRK